MQWSWGLIVRNATKYRRSCGWGAEARFMMDIKRANIVPSASALLGGGARERGKHRGLLDGKQTHPFPH